MKIGIVGLGLIGSEVQRQAVLGGWKILGLARRSGIYTSQGKQATELSEWTRFFSTADAMALCISTVDTGEAAFRYIDHFTSQGIPVVTCEKGALGNFFPELQSRLKLIGYSATVGGGTRIIHWAKDRITSSTQEIHLVINGTLNFIFDGLSRGRALDEMVREAATLQYVEPNAFSPLDILNTEANRDIPMKIAVFLNLCGIAKIRARSISATPLSEQDMKRLVREARIRRYVVSLTREEFDEEDRIGGFLLAVDGWHISAGFKDITQNPL